MGSAPDLIGSTDYADSAGRGTPDDRPAVESEIDMAKRSKGIAARPAAPAEVQTDDAPFSDVKIQTIYCGDNLKKLREMPSGCVDLIYIDPPFNSNRNYEVFWGETKEKRSFEDRHASTEAYIEFMRPRCMELARVLKGTGSFYYHCDWHASHYVIVMLDRIFGENNFRNEIIWRRNASKGLASRAFPINHDSIFYYSSTSELTFNPQYLRYNPRDLDAKTKQKYCHRDSDGRIYRLSLLNNPNPNRPNLTYEFLGVTRVWRWTKERMQAAYEAGLVIQTKPGTVPQYKRYLDEQEGRPIDNVWIDIPPINSQAAERIGYPTQKPIPLLERIIKTSSNPDDIVLDAFCGCGTALEAAQRLDRRWIGIDISPTACRVMSNRLKENCKLREGRDFFVRDLPKTADQLRAYPPFEFENWAVNALNTVLVNGRAIGNRAKVGDMGIDGRIYPIGANKEKQPGKNLFGDADYWLPVQVKQKEKAGRPDIDLFETAMRRQKRDKGFFISFGFTSDAEREIRRIKEDAHDGMEIIPVTVDEILAEEIRFRV